VPVGLPLLTGGVACNAADEKGKEEQHPLVGKPAPDFTLETVDGGKVKLSDLKNKVVVIDFWATWCGPCRLAFPHLQEVANNKALADKGLKVLAIDVEEEKPGVEAFVKQAKYTLTVPLDTDAKVFGAYQGAVFPTTLVVGRDGKVRNVFLGFNPEKSPKELDEAIEKALKEEIKKAD